MKSCVRKKCQKSWKETVMLANRWQKSMICIILSQCTIIAKKAKCLRSWWSRSIAFGITNEHSKRPRIYIFCEKRSILCTKHFLLLFTMHMVPHLQITWRWTQMSRTRPSLLFYQQNLISLKMVKTLAKIMIPLPIIKLRTSSNYQCLLVSQKNKINYQLMKNLQKRFFIVLHSLNKSKKSSSNLKSPKMKSKNWKKCLKMILRIKTAKFLTKVSLMNGFLIRKRIGSTSWVQSKLIC